MRRALATIPVLLAEVLLGVHARRRRRRQALELLARAILLEQRRPRWVEIRVVPRPTFSTVPAYPIAAANANESAQLADAIEVALRDRTRRERGENVPQPASTSEVAIAGFMLRALRVAIDQLVAGATLRTRDIAPLWDLRRMILDGLADDPEFNPDDF